MRVLIDEEELTLHQAWLLTCNTVAYTSHTTGIEFLEKWPVDLVAQILPRHLEIIHYINFFLHEKILRDHPNDRYRLARMSLMETHSDQKQFIRMAYICFLASKKVNGVSMEHTEILKGIIFKDFHLLCPKKIINISNGVSQRRWL